MKYKKYKTPIKQVQLTPATIRLLEQAARRVRRGRPVRTHHGPWAVVASLRAANATAPDHLTPRHTCSMVLFMPATHLRWSRLPDGYTSGPWAIYDNGPGLGPTRGSGRWAVEHNGRWVANIDTLADAKRYAEDRS